MKYQDISSPSLESTLEAKYPGLKLDLMMGTRIAISRIVVPSGERNSGVGTAVMQSITQYADSVNKTITLTPAKDFGGSVARLKEFYKRFGFVENKGRNKDYEISDSMYRLPE